MTDWFRSWHGAPTDRKWLVISRKAGVSPALVSAVVWALFDHASQEAERGSVARFDPESYAAWAEMDEADVRAVIAALTEKGVIANDRLVNWDKRQPKREDDSTVRVRALRERRKRDTQQVTPGNATQRTVTHGNTREEESREEENRAVAETGTDTETAAADACAPEDEAPANTRVAAAAAVRETAEILSRAPWVTDGIDELTKQVRRSFRVTPDFHARDGPGLAELFVRRTEYGRDPPADWYAVWLRWLRNERPRERSPAGVATASRNGTEPKRPAYADVIYVDGKPYDRKELDRR